MDLMRVEITHVWHTLAHKQGENLEETKGNKVMKYESIRTQSYGMLPVLQAVSHVTQAVTQWSII
jgi:hypothetical protein